MSTPTQSDFTGPHPHRTLPELWRVLDTGQLRTDGERHSLAGCSDAGDEVLDEGVEGFF